MPCTEPQVLQADMPKAIFPVVSLNLAYGLGWAPIAVADAMLPRETLWL